jgi:hypothetical protein
MNHKTILEELIPQTYWQPGCDGFGTYPEADKDGAVPAQCQYCYETRLPKLDAALAKIEGMIRDERVNAIKSYKKTLRLGKKAKARRENKPPLPDLTNRVQLGDRRWNTYIRLYQYYYSPWPFPHT